MEKKEAIKILEQLLTQQWYSTAIEFNYNDKFNIELDDYKEALEVIKQELENK